MRLDSHSVLVLAIGPMIGWVMVQAGVFKQMIERRREHRICPSCGRIAQTCTCA